jgi:hypothetical protein
MCCGAIERLNGAAWRRFMRATAALLRCKACCILATSYKREVPVQKRTDLEKQCERLLRYLVKLIACSLLLFLHFRRAVGLQCCIRRSDMRCPRAPSSHLHCISNNFAPSTPYRATCWLLPPPTCWLLPPTAAAVFSNQSFHSHHMAATLRFMLRLAHSPSYQLPASPHPRTCACPPLGAITWRPAARRCSPAPRFITARLSITT